MTSMLTPLRFSFRRKAYEEGWQTSLGLTTSLILICGALYGASIGLTTIEMSGFWFAMSLVILFLVMLLIIAFTVVILWSHPFL